MNEVWNLEPIYKGFDDPAFAQDLEQLQQLIRRSSSYVKTLSDMEPEQGLTGGIQLLEQISELSSRLANYAILRQAADSRDPDAASRVGQVMGIISDTAAPEAAFKAWAAPPYTLTVFSPLWSVVITPKAVGSSFSIQWAFIPKRATSSLQA